MYLHKIKKPNGDIYLSIKEKYSDPIAFFTQKALHMTKEKKAENSANILIDRHKKMSVNTNENKNIGYGILKDLYL